jgi:ceramide glucosyltransferase
VTSAALLASGAAFALGWSGVVASIQIEAIRRAFRLESPSLPPPIGARVLVIRPCAGLEAELDRTLASLVEAPRSFEIVCRFALENEHDPALPAAQRAAASLVARGVDARVVFTFAAHPNRKAAQLAAVITLEIEPFDVILIADSDVDLAGIDLDALVAPLVIARGPDAVWAPPSEHGVAQTAADRASAAVLGASLHAFPLLAGLDPRGLVGKLFAVKRGALAAIGGFDALTAHLGEDLEIARRLLARGGAIAVAPVVARSLASGRSWAEAVSRFARWLGVIRAQRPLLLATYPALFFATPAIVAIATIASPAAPGIALAAILIAVVSRLAVALAAARASGRPVGLARAVVESALADALLAAAFARCLRTRRIVWRESVLTIERTGLIREET